MLVEVSNKIYSYKLIEVNYNIINFDFESRINEWEVQKLVGEHLEKEDEKMIYTDDLKIDDKVDGCSFVSFAKWKEFGDIIYRLSFNYSVFMAEVMAIKLAVEYMYLL
ncbi:hypothetical protein AVEN_157198-1 [Araneus ventricosus]|uniref:Uncharacterized protein n=1 Tax=Araneus ventricosus TaxID=182803 RepID=A0A4Y2EHY7_ARAVE|nr:hypothetical protein AVEN_157198-1 [Araneus ventricosus]